MDSSQLYSLYKTTLYEDVLPFWTTRAIDSDGAINTCICDNGEIISRERWNWSQWRAVWVFSRLHNQGKGQESWLELAQGIFDYVTKAGRTDSGHWPLLLDVDGQVIRGYESIYVDGFVILGLVEYYRSTKNEQALSLAVQTFDAVELALNQSEPPPAWPYPIHQGHQAHAVSMLFSIAYWELAKETNSDEVTRAALRHHALVIDCFLRPSGIVFEWMQVDGRECDPPIGTAVCPGHAIESMWFQIHIARDRNDTETILKACSTIRKHLEIGWDEEFGGLLLAVDANGNQEVAWPHSSTKLWWPQVEALYATLLAHQITGEAWCLDWHERIRTYCYDKFPVPDYGEWKQKLDREGNEITDTLFLPVKDPFHLPRALLLCLEVLDHVA